MTSFLRLVKGLGERLKGDQNQRRTCGRQQAHDIHTYTLTHTHGWENTTGKEATHVLQGRTNFRQLLIIILIEKARGEQH